MEIVLDIHGSYTRRHGSFTIYHGENKLFIILDTPEGVISDHCCEEIKQFMKLPEIEFYTIDDLIAQLRMNDFNLTLHDNRYF